MKTGNVNLMAVQDRKSGDHQGELVSSSGDHEYDVSVWTRLVSQATNKQKNAAI